MRFAARTNLGSLLTVPVSQWMRTGAVKSIQRGTISLSGVTTNTATITAVNVNNTLLKLTGYVDADATNEARYFYVRLALTNLTTVTATIGIAPGASSLVSFEVWEYMPGVLRSVQRGTITMATVTSNTATIAAVRSTSTATCELLGCSTTSANGGNTGSAAVTLTNTTTVTATQGVGSDTVIASYQVADWF